MKKLTWGEIMVFEGLKENKRKFWDDISDKTLMQIYRRVMFLQEKYAKHQGQPVRKGKYGKYGEKTKAVTITVPESHVKDFRYFANKYLSKYAIDKGVKKC